jgi:tetratricopeptide (TPR) repeat protein
VKPALGAVLALAACASPGGGVESASAFPAPLPPREGEDPRQRAELTAAWARLSASPRDEDAIVWYGRRTAYLGDFDGAVANYSRGREIWPDSVALLRHRGHRWLSLRRFDLAIADLARAAELSSRGTDAMEADGVPNARGVPTSTLFGNVWYHLGLAHYLRGEYAEAERAYTAAVAAARTKDAEVAARYWLHHALRRQGCDAEAVAAVSSVAADWDVIENKAYQRLALLYAGKGELADVAAQGGGSASPGTLEYGLARWHLDRGEREEGARILRDIVARGSPSAFGRIAAEVDLAELERGT